MYASYENKIIKISFKKYNLTVNKGAIEQKSPQGFSNDYPLLPKDFFG